MKTLHFSLFVLTVVCVLCLGGCADQPNQTSSNQPNAATAPTPRPQDFQNMPSTGGRY